MLLNVCPHCGSDVLGREFGNWVCYTCGRTTDTLRTIEATTEKELRNKQYVRPAFKENNGRRGDNPEAITLKNWYSHIDSIEDRIFSWQV